MPLSGTRDVSALAERAPRMPSLHTEAWEIKQVRVLQVLYEIDDSDLVGLLPKALNPTIPPTVTFIAWDVPESEAGPFTIAMVRVGCRAGVRPRGLLTRSFCTSSKASELLRDRWGFDVQPGEVTLGHYYDRIALGVVVGGKTILECGITDPDLTGGGDVQYVASMHLARVERDGQQVARLVQVDPDYVFHRAERGKPWLQNFDTNGWAAEGVTPVYPVSASYAICDIRLPVLRYLMDPDKSPFVGTEKI